MANGYPHMVFVQPDAGLDKESLPVFLSGLFPTGHVEDKPLRIDLDLAGYVFSFWFEEAEGVADRYATYLPEGARRRWLSRCEVMIDLHGQPDPDGRHTGEAERIVQALVKEDGVEVFSEDTRRFVGMDYGDGTQGAEPGSTPAMDLQTPAPGSATAAEFAPVAPGPDVVLEHDAPTPVPPTPPVTPTPADATPTPTPAPAAASPSGPAPMPTSLPAADVDPAPSLPAPSPAFEAAAPGPDLAPGPQAPAVATPEAPAAQDDGTRGEQPEEARKGFFKRMFGRR